MTRSRSYADALGAMYALVPRGIVLGLEPMRAALAAWGNPQERLPVAHIAGTNGKGSVAAMVDAGLRAAGKRVGLYTSPHLHRFAERFRVGGQPVGESVLGAAAWRVLDAMERRELPALTFFEAATLVAWEVFSASNVEIAVLEVGLGGRLDATTVCVPSVTAITRIAMDHEAKLGNTLGLIAREKAGILKAAVPCVLGPDLLGGEARDAIDEVAASVGALCRSAPRARALSFGENLRAHIEVDAQDGAMILDLALGGAHQVGNAAVAVGVLEQLGAGRAAIREGLESVKWPARFERIGNVLFDAAHNPDGASALAECIDRMWSDPHKRALVFGASSDKDWRTMLDVLCARFDPTRSFFCAASLRRAEDPEALAAYRGGVACGSVSDAMERARDAVGADGAVIVCGSIFAVAEARGYVLHIESDPPLAM